MPGVFNLSIDEAVKQAEACAARGSAACCSSACRRIRTNRPAAPGRTTASSSQVCELKKSKLDSLVKIADVCVCEYTSHGHCSVIVRDGDHYDTH